MARKSGTQPPAEALWELGFALEQALKALEPAAAEMPALDAVHQQQEFVLITPGAQSEQIPGRRRSDAALALNDLYHDACRTGGDGLL